MLNNENPTYGFSQKYGIQPLNYVNWTNGYLDNKATATPQNDAALADINRQLALGNIVIVDYLSNTNVGQESQAAPVPAYPYNDGDPNNANSLYNNNSFAHFARVVGFSQDGKSILLAQTEDPEKYGTTITIPVNVFLDAWQTPEMRATLGGENPDGVDRVNNWMVVISPNAPSTPTP